MFLMSEGRISNTLRVNQRLPASVVRLPLQTSSSLPTEHSPIPAA